MKRKVLLLEPNYQNKYPPMGLMKLATYYRERGDDVRFFKGDLKDFAATLLCDEYMLEINDMNLGLHWSKFYQFIRNKNIVIESIKDFKDSEYEDILKLYRKKFFSYDYPKFDVICITTLFTFHWKITIDTVNKAKYFLKDNGNMYIGGIASTLLPEYIRQETGIDPIKGLMNKPSMLDKDNQRIIDKLPLDYSILEEINYKYPSDNAYYAYTTRGCPNRCPFCAVPKLEPEYCNFSGIRLQIKKADRLYGAKKDLLLMDNNVFASDNFNKIIDEIKKCGFEKGAIFDHPNDYEIAYNNITAKKKEKRNTRAYIKKMINIYDNITERLKSGTERGNFYNIRKEAGLLYPIYATKEAIINFDPIAHPLYKKYFTYRTRARYIDFNQGLDVRRVTENNMKKLSEINIRPLRIAFDQYTPNMIKMYKNAIKWAAKYGLKDLSNYLLYNYNDKPEDLYERMKLNIDLCEEYGVNIYSFPMKYHPVDDPKYFRNRDYIGKYWNKKFIRTIQAVLNSTKGKIGRGKSFFEEAFGENIEEFMKILWMPETFIIYRRRYDKKLRNRLKKRYTNHYDDENDLANEWWKKFNNLDENQLVILKKIVSDNKFSDGDCETDDPIINNVINYYKIKRK